MAKRTQKKITPARIMRIYWAATESLTLATAAQYDVFTHIASGKTTPREIARVAKCSARAIERLLNALVGMELLKKADGRYALTPEAELFLVRGRSTYLGEMVAGSSY